MKKICFIMNKVRFLKVWGICLGICFFLFFFTAAGKGQFYYPFGYQQPYNTSAYQQSNNYYNPYYVGNYGLDKLYDHIYNYSAPSLINQLLNAFGGLNQPFGDSSFNVIGPQNSLVWWPHIPELSSLFYYELGEPRLSYPSYPSYPYAYNNNLNQPYGYNWQETPAYGNLGQYYPPGYYYGKPPILSLVAYPSPYSPFPSFKALVPAADGKLCWTQLPGPTSIDAPLNTYDYLYQLFPWLQQAKIPSIPPPQLLHIYDELGYARED